MAKRSNNSESLPHKITGADEFAAWSTHFRPRVDLTYRLLEDLTLTDLGLRRSLFTGTTMRSCRLTGVDLSRCDLDGMRLENCEFTRCNLRNVDLRSCSIARCVFRQCTFDDAFFTDCSVRETTFDDSRFARAAISESTFSSCTLARCAIAMSSVVQNRFSATTFAEMTLGHCTFLYNFAKHCTFRDVGINAESLGMVFGLTADDVAAMRLVFLGQEQRTQPSSEVIPRLVETYQRRRWYLGVAVLRMNFQLTSIAYALSEYLRTLHEPSTPGTTIKREELRFLSAILQDLAEERRLPLMSCLDAVETIASLERSESDAEERSHRTTLVRGVSAQLVLTMTRMLEEFEQQRLPIDAVEQDGPARVSLRFHAAPSVSLANLLTQVNVASGLSGSRPSRTIKTQRGSYIEYVETTLLSVLALQVFLFLVTGCVIRFTELRARVGALIQKRLPPAYINDALQARQPVPAILVDPLRLLMRHAATVDWLSDPGLQGYASENLLEGSIERRSSGSAKRPATSRPRAQTKAARSRTRKKK